MDKEFSFFEIIAKKGAINFFVLLFILFLIFLFNLSPIAVIDPGYVGVVYNAFGGIDYDRVMQPGWNIKLPILQSIIPVMTARDTINLHDNGDDIPISAPTSEGLMVVMDLSVFYRVMPEKAPSIIQSLTEYYRHGTIIPRIRSITREVTGNATATQLYGPGRAAIEAEIFSKLKTEFEKDGFVLEAVLIRKIQLPESIVYAVEQKRAAEELIKQKENEVEVAKQEAERMRQQQKGLADAAIIKADGEAKSKILIAEAEAQALEKINSVLSKNSNLLSYRYIQALEANSSIKTILVPTEGSVPVIADVGN